LYSPINDDDDEGFQKNDVEKSWFGDTTDDLLAFSRASSFARLFKTQQILKNSKPF
jgi:hypothetical protein